MEDNLKTCIKRFMIFYFSPNIITRQAMYVLRRVRATTVAVEKQWVLHVKPSQSANWGAQTCAKRKSTSPCLLAIPAFDRIAGLYNRHLNSNRGIHLR
jgi:hypothetical protein